MIKFKPLLFAGLAVAWFAPAAPAEPGMPEAEQQGRLIRFAPERFKPLDAALPDREFLLRIASDTWGYFRDVVDRETGLPLDNVVVASTFTKVNSFTTTTNVGLYLMCLVSARDLGFIDDKEAGRRIDLVLNSLDKLKTWEGQFFNYYFTITLRPSGEYVSSVDNGWLAAGLIVIRQTYPDRYAERVDRLLDQLDFSKLYDPEVGQLRLGYDAGKNEISPYHYGLLCTEPRVASFIAIAKRDVPREHWFRLYRTPPKEWKWQRQKPRGRARYYEGLRVFQGHYKRWGYKFVPSWGGSLFEFLMPTLVLEEPKLAPDGLGLNDARAVQLQIRYAETKKYPVWGFSPCATPEDPLGYREYGVPGLGVKGYPDEGVVTPHAAFLALAVAPEQAVQNVRRLAAIKGIYGEYGFYDSVNVRTGRTASSYLCLDQAMSFIALNNHLNDGAIRKRFHSYPPIAEHADLLKKEKFF